MAASLIAISLAACGGSASRPELTDLRVGAPTGPNAALYLTATGYGTADRLLSASTDVAPTVELHETVMSEDDGTMSMRPVEAYELPADGELVLEPGGPHIMLVGVDRLEQGTTIEVRLVWENAGEMAIEVPVVEPSQTMGG